MPLTPEDVRNKRFTPVRLREGYAMEEVDQFLDEVETELERLAATGNERDDETPTTPTALTAPTDQDTTGVGPDPNSDGTPAQPPPEATTSVGAASVAAARLMELAGHNADQVLAEAQREAKTILEDARSRADRIDAESAAEAEARRAEAQATVQSLDAETAARRAQLLDDIVRERDEMTSEVQHLQAFEREYRSRLKLYLAARLAELDDAAAEPAAHGDGVAVAAVDTAEPVANGQPGAEPAPSRLQSLLAEDPDRKS